MSRPSHAAFRVEYAELSDLGMRRANNQDAVAAVAESRDSAKRSGAGRGDIFMVADGMGAHAAGELASKLAVDCIPHAYKKQAEGSPPAALRQAVRKANQLIHAKGQSSAEFQGMGTTCSCLVLLESAALIAHVGDSRVYRLRDEQFEQLTFDHSLVWELAAASHTTADKVPDCIPKNVITRSLGPHEHVNVDIEGPYDLVDGDVFLICSDGLTAVVEDDLAAAVVGAMPPAEAGQTLIDIANLRGGPDNISVVVARVTGEGTPSPPAPAAVDDSAVSDSTVDYPPVAPQPVNEVPKSTWAMLAVCGTGALWFATQQDYTWALAASVGFGAMAMIALWQRGSGLPAPTPAEPLGGPYGDGPYRKIDCVPGKPAAEAIGAVVEQLAELEGRDASEGGPPIDDWTRFHTHRESANEAAQSGDLGAAVRGYSDAIRDLMDQVRANRTVDYAPEERI